LSLYPTFKEWKLVTLNNDILNSLAFISYL